MRRKALRLWAARKASLAAHIVLAARTLLAARARIVLARIVLACSILPARVPCVLPTARVLLDSTLYRSDCA